MNQANCNVNIKMPIVQTLSGEMFYKDRLHSVIMVAAIVKHWTFTTDYKRYDFCGELEMDG